VEGTWREFAGPPYEGYAMSVLVDTEGVIWVTGSWGSHPGLDGAKRDGATWTIGAMPDNSSGITIGESYFFRDDAQMAFLRDVFFPQLIQRRREQGDLKLRIWSAGCSSGQELYSLCIMLHELLPDIDRWHLHLLGTDINPDALSDAIRGRYSEWSLRAISDECRQRYFTPAGNEHKLDAGVRQQTRFAYLNLKDDSYPSILNETNALDLIMCRNVFIYLQKQLLNKVVTRMRDCLQHEGMLMLGATDTVNINVRDFTLHNHGYVHYYRKTLAPSTAPSPMQPAVTPSAVSKPHGDRTLQRRPVPARQTPHRPQQQPPAETRLSPHAQAIIELIRASDWQAIVEQTESSETESSGLLQQFRAKALANLGRLDEAAQACELSLEQEKEKHTYFIYGMVLAEQERHEEAAQALQKALYLDRFFVEAWYQLGLLQMRTGQHKAGLKNLMNARDIAARGDPERRIHDTSDMRYGRFMQILDNEIEIYRGLFSAGNLQNSVGSKQ